MTTTLKLKFIRETDLARWYENSRGVRQWVPRSVCTKTFKAGDQHEVAIEDWWLEQNPWEKKDAAQDDLFKPTKKPS